MQIIFYISNFELLKNISLYVNSNETTLLKLKKKFKKIDEYSCKNPIRLGDEGRVVQIDETKINFHMKSHRGKYFR